MVAVLMKRDVVKRLFDSAAEIADEVRINVSQFIMSTAAMCQQTAVLVNIR